MIDWNFQNLGPGQNPPNPSDSVESETSYGVSPDAGASDDFSRADHTHGTPAALEASSSVTSETTFGLSSNAGSASTFSKGDHTHGTPPEPDLMPVRPPASGEYTTGIFNRLDQTAYGVSLIADYIYFIPILLGWTATYDRIAASIDTLATPPEDHRVVFGIYPSTSKGLPTSSVICSTSEITPASSGWSVIHGTINQELGPGLYFIGVASKYNMGTRSPESGCCFGYRLTLDGSNIVCWRFGEAARAYNGSMPTAPPTLSLRSGWVPQIYLRAS